MQITRYRRDERNRKFLSIEQVKSLLSQGESIRNNAVHPPVTVPFGESASPAGCRFPWSMQIRVSPLSRWQAVKRIQKKTEYERN